MKILIFSMIWTEWDFRTLSSSFYFDISLLLTLASFHPCMTHMTRKTSRLGYLNDKKKTALKWAICLAPKINCASCNDISYFSIHVYIQNTRLRKSGYAPKQVKSYKYFFHKYSWVKVGGYYKWVKQKTVTWHPLHLFSG